MFSLDRDMVSVILISLDIGLPIVALFTAVFGLAVVFHRAPAKADVSSTSSALRLVLTEDALKFPGVALDGSQTLERSADASAGPFQMPI